MTTTVVDPDLTPVQAKIYEALRQCWLVYGQAPSQYELQRAVGCSSTSVQNDIRSLRNKGYITAVKFGIRNAKPSDMERQVLNQPVDPFAELEPAPTYWKDQ